MTPTDAPRRLILPDADARTLREAGRVEAWTAMKRQPLPGHEPKLVDGEWWPHYHGCGEMVWVADGPFVCPRPRPGDAVWIAEAWASPARYIVAYRSDAECGAWVGDGGGNLLWIHHGYTIEAEHYKHVKPPLRTWSLVKYGERWRPAAQMPQEYSRTAARVASVRVERRGGAWGG